jgi:squalene synthase HpnC
MAVDHYENFPVASRLMPSSIRQDVVNLYRFARFADDVADEGQDTPAQRLQKLKLLHVAVNSMALSNDSPPPPPSFDANLDAVCVSMAATVKRHHLPISLLSDLLSAFEQDIQVHRYPSNKVLLEYCSRSANPVGRLMLCLFKHQTPQAYEQSDQICTALQLINFLQDVAVDYQKGRIYLPQEDLQKYGVTEADLASGQTSGGWQQLMKQYVAQCRNLLKSGQPLGRALPGRLGLELRLIIQGGTRILDKIESVQYDVFRKRPILKPVDWLLIFWRAI